jgi:hypothetical protein
MANVHVNERTKLKSIAKVREGKVNFARRIGNKDPVVKERFRSTLSLTVHYMGVDG